jgi:L-iditol 2-dehydrogenase
MKSAVLTGPHDIQVQEEPVPSIEPDEVLVRVAYCGVCTSELDFWTGKAGDRIFPRQIGHEVSGTVEEVGDDVTAFRAGDPVAVWVTNRGFSEYVAVKEMYCLPAAGVPLDLALAEPLACAVNTVELADLSLADDVVIIGAGFMGNLVQKLVQLQGPARVIVADTRQDALDRALRLGATHAVSPNELPALVREITDGRGADVSFEVTGAQDPLLLLGDVTRMSGKVVLVGFHQGGMRQLPLAHWNYQAYEILNAHFREEATIMRGMRIGMRLLTHGRLSLDGLVTHRFPLDGIAEAFTAAEEKPEGFVKSTVRMGA